MGLILACAKTTPTALTPEGSRVRVSESIRVEGCEYRGDFVGWARGSGKGPWTPLAENRARNLASEQGATDLVLEFPANGDIIGKGYRCL
jgi:hypothetical protein